MSETQTTALVVNDPNKALTSDVSFSGKFMRIKPTTLVINQPMTQADGAIKGKIRVVETGEQFDSITVVLMSMPRETRKYEEGEFPDRKCLCFSTDMLRPHANALVPQAVTCKGCPQSDWSAWREYSERFGKSNPTLVPKCNSQYVATFLDTETKLPSKMYIKSNQSRKAFDKGMENVARELLKLKTKGLNPQIYDVQFTLTTEKQKDGANYFLKIIGNSVHAIDEKDRQAFGDIYTQYISQFKKTTEQSEAEQEQKNSDAIEAEFEDVQDISVLDDEVVNL
jgi:hypothetical protein